MIETPICFPGLNPPEYAVAIFSNSLCIIQGRNKEKLRLANIYCAFRKYHSLIWLLLFLLGLVMECLIGSYTYQAEL